MTNLLTPLAIYQPLPGHTGRGRTQPILAITIHRQSGNDNPWNYFLKCGLDKPTSCYSTIWISKTGQAYRFLKDSDKPWTNGLWTEPIARSNPVINKMLQFGLDGSNDFCLTAEVEGFISDAVTPAQLETLALWCAFWCFLYKLDPKIAITKHSDVGPHKFCPGDSFPFAELIEKVVEKMNSSFNPNPYNFTASLDVLDYCKAANEIIGSNEQSFEPAPSNPPGLLPISLTYLQSGRLLIAYKTEDDSPHRTFALRS